MSYPADGPETGIFQNLHQESDRLYSNLIDGAKEALAPWLLRIERMYGYLRGDCEPCAESRSDSCIVARQGLAKMTASFWVQRWRLGRLS
jgi:hypothetical protein